ncbi:leukocyte receptor cluster member 1 homolog [Octopus sinensis]|uniref:Leukocyte receptor cluster member 1 homolog n=1 Tax=Octopus sinensis TaxID=2607531 RepID=A0A6P7U0U2_9MOLL|nr:leukocyte receptor cluster member 1 homolog [Octopus sinensis]
MNINPKKSWHVRNKHNVAIVREDEAKALAEKMEEQRKIDLADSEYRLRLLRSRAAKDPSIVTENAKIVKKTELTEHVNFFMDEEKGLKASYLKNAETEQEKKDSQEDWEKKIGYLNYLGVLNRDNPDLSVPWYLESARLRKSEDSLEDSGIESDRKRKSYYDPLNDVKRATSKDQSIVRKDDSIKKQEQSRKSIDTLRNERHNSINSISENIDMKRSILQKTIVSFQNLKSNEGMAIPN